MSESLSMLRDALAGRYELGTMVGRGGMATVYRATDVKHRRTVAVKVLRADLGELIGSERFLREIEIAAHLMHPHILPLYDSGEAAGVLYYVMPFVADESLRGLLNRVRLMDTAGAVEIAGRLAAALDYAHGQGILHRDLKPENVLLPGGQAVLADFGIAKAVSSATAAGGLTRTGIALGTPGYMSPEQAAGLLDLTRATDIYSLGVVVHEMLLGGVPRTWVTPDALAAGRFLDAAPDHRQQLDRLPPGMERALTRALALRPEERYVTAGDFAAALERPETAAMPARPVPAPIADAAPAPRDVSETATAQPPIPGGAGETFLGAPTRVIVEHVVDGVVSPEDHDVLLEEIRAVLGRVGFTTRAGSSVYWSTRKPKEPLKGFDLDSIMQSAGGQDGPDILVRIVSRHGQTRIWIEQRLGETAGGIFGGVWGGGGAGTAATLIAIGVATGAPPEVVISGGAALIAGGYALSRWIYRMVAASKRRLLEDLADRLAEQAADLAR